MTATNLNVNIVQWFGDNILRLLQAAACIRRCRSIQSGTCTHSSIRLVFIILSITRIHLCLRQLRKVQLVSVLPLLLSHLESQQVVVYTYAAVALDRILSCAWAVPRGSCTGLPLPPVTSILIVKFAGSDLRTCSRSCVSFWMFSSPSSGQHSPERNAENDLLMRCECAF